MKWLKLEVTRMEGTEAYVQVPDDFDQSVLMHGTHAKQIGEAIDKSHSDDEWDNYGWQDTVEVQSIKNVSDEEASRYTATVIDVEAIKARIEEHRQRAKAVKS